MRIKSKAIAVALICCLLPTNVSAGTAADLYELYGKEFQVKYPESVTQTISKYQEAKKYAAMYQYVITSEYDDGILQKRAEELKKTITSAETTLLNGYSMDIEDIYETEESYKSSLSLLEDTELAMQRADVQYNVPTVKDVPTYTEYCNARTLKSCYDTYSNIGSIKDITYPVDSACLVEYEDATKLKLATIKESVVVSLFNGVVVDVHETDLTISHRNGVYTFYGGLKDIAVEVGEEVKQGQPIGYSSGHLTLKLKIDDEIVDIAKLFKR